MRLYIHDDEERHAHHDDEDGIIGLIRQRNTIRLPVKTLADLHSGLAQLVKDGKTFRRVLWMTHGVPGGICFGDDRLNSDTLPDFAGKGYQKLFPKTTKMYFSGCNVAGDEECNGACNPATRDVGWKFLENVGKVFLQAGGYTMAWTSLGHGWNSKILRAIASTHSLHFSGDVRIVTFGSGGKILERLSYNDDFWTGDVWEKYAILSKLTLIVPENA
ncbi:MAG: hypothetical protein ACJ8D4_08970 [Xanthobacteraceae bacterium]